MSSSKTPCAACKLQRRKCTPECVFAPYFPPDIPQKFQNVHLVFGASNVSKILTDLNVAERERAVRSLAYEADSRMKDPVYGCVGLIALRQQELRYLTNELEKANKELAIYEGPQGLQPFLVPGLDPHNAGTAANNVYGPSSVYPYNNMPPQAMAAARGGGNLVIRDPQQQQQLVAGDMELRKAQQLYGIYDQQPPPPPPQKDFMSYGGGGSVSGSGFNQAAEMSASLALNTFDIPYQSVQLQRGQGGDRHPQQQNQHQHHHHHHRHNLQEQLLLPPQQTQHQNQPLHHQLQEQLLLSSQQPQQQQLQPQPHHHHQLQEQLFTGSQQPQRQQDQHHQHHQLQEQMLLQPQPQHQDQSKDEDGRSIGPT